MKLLFGNLLIMSVLFIGACEKKQQTKNTIDLAPVAELVLYDRGSVEQYDDNIGKILKQHDSIQIPSLYLTAHIFIWGGETGGPSKRVFSFCRDTGALFQRNFFYDGEYDMSRITRLNCMSKGTEVPLGIQLSRLSYELGPDIYLNKDKMKDLLSAVMVKLLRCPEISAGYIENLKNSSNVTQFDPKTRKELIQSLEKIKLEMTQSNNPYVLFFQGELSNGIWKATIRQYDHTGRNCIDLTYLNGQFVTPMWM